MITRASTSADTHAADVQCFGYDGLQALTDAWTPAGGDCATGPTAARGGPAPYRATYTVDPDTGNRTSATKWSASSATTATYTYPAAGQPRPHAVAEVVTETGSGLPQTTSYGYDAAGATTGRGGQALTFDESGRLATVADGSTTERSLYTADGSLLMRWGGVDGASLFLGETVLRSKDAVTTGIRSYTVAGITVAERVSGTGGGLWWLSPDPVGTVGLQINVATGVVTRRWMDPFGVNRGTSTAWSSMFGYLNAPASATGLTQLGARAYDPGLGRFVSVDPLLDTGEPRHANAYSYSYNSPVSYSDPTGLISTSKYMADGSRGYTYTGKTGTGKKSQPSAPPPPGNTSSSTNTSGTTWSGAPAYMGGCGSSYNPCGAPKLSAEQRAASSSASAHGALTALGLVPGVGEIADGLDALLCLTESDLACAGMSAAAMTPVRRLGRRASEVR